MILHKANDVTLCCSRLLAYDRDILAQNKSIPLKLVNDNDAMVLFSWGVPIAYFVKQLEREQR